MQLIPVECSTSCRFAKQKIENAGKSLRAGLSILKTVTVLKRRGASQWLRMPGPESMLDSGGAVLDYEFAFFFILEHFIFFLIAC